MAEWVSAGRASRREDGRVRQGTGEVGAVRRRPRREVVPDITIVESSGDIRIKLSPPGSGGRRRSIRRARSRETSPRCFRTTSALEAKSAIARRSCGSPCTRRSGTPARSSASRCPRILTHDYMSHTESGARRSNPDFYVLALPLEETSRLAVERRTGTARDISTDVWQTSGVRSASASAFAVRDGQTMRITRDEHGRPPREYPLRDFSGIQYYFHNHVRIGKGHIYFPEAEWGLSSISQLAYWRERMSSTGAFMGQLSVDIGNFYAPAPQRGASAAHSVRPGTPRSTR